MIWAEVGRVQGVIIDRDGICRRRAVLSNSVCGVSSAADDSRSVTWVVLLLLFLLSPSASYGSSEFYQLCSRGFVSLTSICARLFLPCFPYPLLLFQRDAGTVGSAARVSSVLTESTERTTLPFSLSCVLCSLASRHGPQPIGQRLLSLLLQDERHVTIIDLRLVLL